MAARSSICPTVPISDIISAPPSAQAKLSMLRWLIRRAVNTSRMALMIQRVMKAKSQAIPRVATVKIANSSQPSRKFRMPKMAATRSALPKLLNETFQGSAYY